MYWVRSKEEAALAGAFLCRPSPQPHLCSSHPSHLTSPFPRSLSRCPLSPSALGGLELDAQFLWLHVGINEKSWLIPIPIPTPSPPVMAGASEAKALKSL